VDRASKKKGILTLSISSSDFECSLSCISPFSLLPCKRNGPLIPFLPLMIDLSRTKISYPESSGDDGLFPQPPHLSFSCPDQSIPPLFSSLTYDNTSFSFVRKEQKAEVFLSLWVELTQVFAHPPEMKTLIDMTPRPFIY